MTARLLAVLLLLAGPSFARADAPANVPAKPATTPADKVNAEPIDRQPYRIELHLVADPSARIDESSRENLVNRWRDLVHRFIGASWSISVAARPSPLVGDGLARLKADAITGFDPALDKIWLVWVDSAPEDGGLVFSGREYDVATRWLGPLQQQKAPSRRDLPRSLFAISRNLFSPSALITGQEGGRALLKVRGSALAPASDLGAVVAKGTTFIPLRLVSMKDDSVRISRIAYTYLVAESIEGSSARCAIVSAFRDPLTQRISRPNTLAALGVKAGDSPLRLRFVTKTDKTPAAGYTLTERAVPDGVAREVGMTDRSGRILVEPGTTRALVKLRLLAGGSEPLAEFPIMPGESSEEREVAVDPLPLAAKYQVRLDALRDEVVDQVALRGRLERMMQSRVDGDEWDGLDALLKEYAALPAPATFTENLTKMKDEATKQAYETSKSTVLTKNLQAQFSDLQALVDGYLSNEAYGAYSEVLQKKKKDVADAAKLTAKKKAARP
ncbi:MAG: hypothetical protein P4L85_15935, partial [Paludisphaera borealis]|uniref:hypothetical protein n=1 Tax=Paludisphaera borealis TaxID=1387353 RepID=UPI00284765A6